jgi:ferredoxin
MSDYDARLFVTVDLKKCCGYTTCADVCPEVYKLDDDGFAYTEDGRVPLGLEEKARAGADACPEGAIELFATDPAPSATA